MNKMNHLDLILDLISQMIQLQLVLLDSDLLLKYSLPYIPIQDLILDHLMIDINRNVDHNLGIILIILRMRRSHMLLSIGKR